MTNAANKVIPNGNHASYPANGAANPESNPGDDGQAGANVPLPNGAPGDFQTNGQSQQAPQQDPQQNGLQQNGQQNPNVLHKVVSDVAAVPGQAAGTAHDVAHSAVNVLPGGKQATQLTHGIAQNLVPGGHGLLHDGTDGGEQNGQQQEQQQQEHPGGLLNPINQFNTAKQLPGQLFNHGA